MSVEQRRYLYNALEGVLGVATHWLDGIKSLPPPSHTNFNSMTWTYVRTLDIYTLAWERQILLADFESGVTSIIKTFLWVAILYLLLLPLLESSHLDANVSSSIPSTCPQKTLHHSSFLPFSLLAGSISRAFAISSSSFVPSDALPYAARCTKLNVKSSYNQTRQWMKRWKETAVPSM